MAASVQEAGARPAIGDREFQALSRLIYDHCGINISEGKRTLLETRLAHRLKQLRLATYKDYCKYLADPAVLAQELVPLVDQITTNKTDFFREPNHFDYLVHSALPDLVERGLCGAGRTLEAWSAACSTGEEPYTLAMVLSEYASQTPGFRFRILATDISTRVLKAASSAIYEQERVEPVPPALRKKYLMRSKDPARREVRIVPELRGLVDFRRLNFMDAGYGLESAKQVVFCRNVIIYFDRPTQERVLGRIAREMPLGGYIFMGHSETLFGLDVPFEPVAPTVYKRAR